MIAFFTSKSKFILALNSSFSGFKTTFSFCFYCKAVFRENHRIFLYSYILMMKAFSKVYSSRKITVFPALESNMFSVCFTDWFFIPVFSVCICVYVVVFFFSFMYHGTRADINECEQVSKPCAYQCFNTPGSFKCICPPGQHLLGDGKSCAGLERLPNYGTQYNSYNLCTLLPHEKQLSTSTAHYRQYSSLQLLLRV